MLRHAVADPRMERPVVVGHEARVVDEAVRLDELERRVGEIGRRRPVAERLDADPLEHVERPLHVGRLLVARLPRRVDVRVRVVRDLVAALEDRLGLLRERLDGVAGDEEGRADAVPLEQVEHARDADAGAVLAAGEHRRRRPLVAEPDGKGVEIERQADRARRHRAMLTIGLDRRLMLFEMGFPGSPRARRRLLWIGGLLLVTVVAAAAVVALPKGHEAKEVFRPGRVGSDHAEEGADDAPQRRQAVNRVLDTFVPAAVERKDPMRALPLVTPAYRSGTSRREWSRGELPVFPFYTSNRSFHTWTLNYSYPQEMSVEILLHPAAKETLGAQAFTVVLKETKGRWLIDSFVPSASFAPAEEDAEDPRAAGLHAVRGRPRQQPALRALAAGSRSGSRADRPRPDRDRACEAPPLAARVARLSRRPGNARLTPPRD